MPGSRQRKFAARPFPAYHCLNNCLVNLYTLSKEEHMRKLIILGGLASLGFLAGADRAPQTNILADAAMKTAVCEIAPIKDSKVKGTVTFMQMGDKVHV